MTTRVAVAGGGNWTTAGTWSPSGTPTAADDLQLNATSGAVTIDSGAVGRSLDCTGYTGTLTHTAGVTLTLGDATAGAGNVALKLVAGMTYTIGAGTTLQFQSTSATQQTITTAGKSVGGVNLIGAGSSYLLGDSLTQGSAAATFTITSGTFATGNQAMTLGLMVISGATAKTLTLGSSAVAITGNSSVAVNVSGTGITFTANTAVLTFSGTSAGVLTGNNWNGTSLVFASTVTANARINGSPTFANVTVNGPAAKTLFFEMNSGNPTLTGSLTVTGNSAVNRVLMASNTAGTARTVTVGTAVSLSNVDFADITAAGAAGTWTGTSMGNALGNSNITFDAPATQTRSGAGGNWSTAGNWTSRVPLPQDNVIINASASGTITADMPRLGADVDFTGFTGTASFASVANSIYGSINLASGMTLSGTQTLTLSARSSKTITSNGKAFTQSVAISAPGGTYTLADAFTMPSAGVLNLTSGTFSSASFAMNIPSYSASSGTTTTLGTTTVTLTSTSAAQIWGVSGGATFSGASSTLVIANATANARSFLPGGQTYGTLTYTVAGSTGSLTMTASGTFGTINFSDATNARSLLFTAATTTTVTNWNVNGTSGKLMTVDSATAAQHSLVKAGGGVVSSDYLNVAHSDATPGTTWYAGANSVNGGNDSGWIFTAPPSGVASRRMLAGVGA